jgi:hypothetical protein
MDQTLELATVSRLQPGDLVFNGADSAVFVTSTPHPFWPSMQLVLWKMNDGTWSHDALVSYQEVGKTFYSIPKHVNI